MKTRAQFEASRRIWKHNSFLGIARHARGGMSAILSSETATNESKIYAVKIQDLCDLLYISLKERRP